MPNDLSSPARSRLVCAVLSCLLGVTFASAQDRGQDAGVGRKFELSLEVRANYRSSDLNRFPIRFPFAADQLPPGQATAFLQTVDPGDHLELSAIVLEAGFNAGERWSGLLKLDGVDKYDRNPTSTDNELDIDELWIRFGSETEPALLPTRRGGYVKLGKFPHFERQDDRHLESYGMVSTAFNRMEDIGVEAGFDLGRHLFVKASYTQGNPLFLRDPNALAGDNGTPGLLERPARTELGSGIVIPYDADVDEVDFENPQLAIGAGVRFANQSGSRGVEVLVFHRQRQLAATVELDNTFYGGDLDLLLGPTPSPRPFAITDDDKEEEGANLWLYVGPFSLFSQIVDQDLAGLPRLGFEVEAAWRIELPVFAGIRGRQVLPFVQPAVRYSKLDPDFAAPPQTPSPSFAWEWEKLDAGVRIGLIGRTDLTIEYARNRFILGSGAEAENDETLVTLRIHWGRR